MKKFLIGMVVFSLAELAIIIALGRTFGVLNTLVLLIATSIIGIYAAKNKGMHSIQKVKHSLARGEAPGPAVVDTMLNFSGGLLLALPGFISDIVGLLLLMPFTRKMFQPLVFVWMRKKLKKGQFIIVQK